MCLFLLVVVRIRRIGHDCLLVGLLAITACLGAPGTAWAGGVVRLLSDDPQVARYQAWVDGVARRGYRVPTGEVNVVFAPHPSAPDRGMAVDRATGTIYIDPTKETRDRTGRREWRYDFLHELGHVIDRQMSDVERQHFSRVLRNRRPWRADGGNSPHEQFAEAYALTTTGRRAFGRAESVGYGLPVDARRERLIRRAFQRAEADPIGR